MNLMRVADSNFVLLDDDTTVAQAKEFIEYTEASHIIIYRHQLGEDLYYLVTIADARKRLEQSDDSASLLEALDLHESPATPTLEGSSSAESAPDRCVIVSDGRLVGFFDADQPPFEGTRGSKGFAYGSYDFDVGDPRVEAGQGEVVERYLQAEFPEKVSLNETASLLVYLTADQLYGMGLAIQATEGTVLDIVVQARRGFEIEGKANGQLTITGESESPPILFKLKAKEPGQGDIRVLVFQNGVTVGYLKLNPIVVEEQSDNLRTNTVSHRYPISPLNAAWPDLSMHIEGAIVDGKKGFRVYVTATDPELELNLAEYGPFPFEVDPGPYFDEFYGDIENYSLSTPEEREIALRELEGKGLYLFSSLFPEKARKKLWEIKDRVSTVFIQSSEPWIPWELCKLSGTEDGRVVEGPFFSEAFAVTRWMPGIGVKPRINLKNLAIVVPSDSGLPFASDELNYLLSLAGENRKVTRVPARYLDLYKAFQAGEYDVWHFSGHGASRGPDPDRSIMVLENDEKFFPQRIVGALMNLGQAKPLVFLNACQIGRSGLSLIDVGGWARQFLLAGAGAFVGAYWSVYDQPAFQFAQELYQRLLVGIPIGEAARQARLAIRSDGDPTWLAYTVFAHPLAKVK